MARSTPYCPHGPVPGNSPWPQKAPGKQKAAAGCTPRSVRACAYVSGDHRLRTLTRVNAKTSAALALLTLCGRCTYSGPSR